MREKKQIEEIRKDIFAAFGGYAKWEEDWQSLAEAVYNAGYRKQSEGEWILTGTFKSTFPLPVADLYTACSVCRWTPPKYSDDYKKYNYCPNCGAKMKGGAE